MTEDYYLCPDHYFSATNENDMINHFVHAHAQSIRCPGKRRTTFDEPDCIYNTRSLTAFKAHCRVWHHHDSGPWAYYNMLKKSQYHMFTISYSNHFRVMDNYAVFLPDTVNKYYE